MDYLDAGGTPDIYKLRSWLPHDFGAEWFVLLPRYLPLLSSLIRFVNWLLSMVLKFGEICFPSLAQLKGV